MTKTPHPPITVKQYRRTNRGPVAVARARCHAIVSPRFAGDEIHGRALCGRASIGKLKRWNPGGDVICDTSTDLSNITCLGCLRKAYDLDMLVDINWSALINNVSLAHRRGACWGIPEFDRVPERIRLLLIDMRRQALTTLSETVIAKRQATYDTLDWQEHADRQPESRPMM